MRKLMVVLGIISAVTILTCGTALVYSSHLKATEPPTVVTTLNADTIFNLVNNERTKAGLKPLVRDARLDATAQTRADDMVARNYFSHYDPIDGHKLINDKYYIDAWSICSHGSENISMNWPTNAKTVSGWMGSKLHHDAILKADYTLTGVAVSGNKVVQHFCVAK